MSVRNFIFDLESVPKSEAELIALMPPELANPIMPEALRNPPDVDLSKCPIYGGDTAKQEAWKQKKVDDDVQTRIDARSAWEEKAIEAKQKFIDDAALSPVTGTVKLIGVKDVQNNEAHIFTEGAPKDVEAFLQRNLYPCKVRFHFYETEAQMLTAFSTAINSAAVIPGSNDQESDFKLVGFFTHGFDFQFIFKRCWILGVLAPWLLRKGRYWNTDVSADLYDIFTFGDRSQKTGGLEGLCRVLGTRGKSGSGEFFWRLWESDPVAAVLYLIDDLRAVEEAATRMGVIRPMKGAK